MSGNAVVKASKAAVVAKVTKLLMADESIIAAADQTDFSRWWIWPTNGVVVTSHRVLFVYQSFLGFRFVDFHWEHVEDIHISQSMTGSLIRVTASKSKSGIATKIANQRTTRTAVGGLKKNQAAQVYSAGQQMEHEWRETNRQRVMEETRASKGGYLMHAAPAPATTQAPAPVPQAPGPMERLTKLKQMLDASLITEAEFEGKKAELLALL